VIGRNRWTKRRTKAAPVRPHLFILTARPWQVLVQGRAGDARIFIFPRVFFRCASRNWRECARIADRMTQGARKRRGNAKHLRFLNSFGEREESPRIRIPISIVLASRESLRNRPLVRVWTSKRSGSSPSRGLPSAWTRESDFASFAEIAV